MLVPDGQFGSRYNPEASAPRYIYTKGSEWLKILFDDNEKLIYHYNKSDDGDKIEPTRLYPKVPLQLINGSLGIASGWSNYTPSFKLKDVANNIIQYLTKGTFSPMMPWYRDYLGTLTVEDGKIVCTGKHKYEIGVLTIYDTHIATYRTKLTEYL